MTWKILDNDEGKMEEKITVEQVVEAISRLDSKDLAKLGDELAIRKLNSIPQKSFYGVATLAS